MDHLGENPSIRFALGGDWSFKVVKMSAGDHKIIKWVAKSRKGT